MVTITAACSLRRRIRWHRNWPPDWANGRWHAATPPGTPFSASSISRWRRRPPLLSDGSAEKVFDDAVLREAFDFTPAEARLTSELAAGGSAKDAATRMSLSHETVRAHLKRMFDKTRTARQAELLRLLERYGHRPRKD